MVLVAAVFRPVHQGMDELLVFFELNGVDDASEQVVRDFRSSTGSMFGDYGSRYVLSCVGEVGVGRGYVLAIPQVKP